MTWPGNSVSNGGQFLALTFRQQKILMRVSSFKLLSKRDPRLGRIRGGSFGTRSERQIRRISTLDPFFAQNGTHRSPGPDVSSVYCRQRSVSPGPGSYKTPFTIGIKEPNGCFDATRSSLKRFPQPILVGRHQIKGDVLAPGPCDYSPVCGYTTFL